ncbi:DUF488 domain-containing protein [Mycobacterium asiaticum]|uniref:DNA repair protein n=1 Tax=Mycobacterium asiaticum TaxID=1790 RepID=A0A1A3MY76_MYCAS|nr:DUF488 domain-containing protein [Mycobacterium asiaticum]OBK14481.1 DNA repair protein [Mycobacterium asiaticum]
MTGQGLITVGHGTSGRTKLTTLLHGAGVAKLVDVRTAPGSRRNPDATLSELQCWLPATDIEYRWEKRLGGWRKAAPDSPDIVWRNVSFRGYAAYMRDPDFVAAIEPLLEDVAQSPTAVMCSETLWWRCHRRLIADFVVLSRRVPVHHLMQDGRLVPHVPTPGVRLRADGLLIYDDIAASLQKV